MPTITAKQHASDFKGDHLSAKMFGAKGSAVPMLTAATLTAGSIAVDVPGHDFNLMYDEGPYQGIEIEGAGAGGDNYIGWVVGISGNTVRLSPPTITTVSAGAAIKHEDTAAIQSALDAAIGELIIPASPGPYRIRTIKPKSNSRITLHAGAVIDIVDDDTATGNSIFLDAVDNVTIEGGKITSSNADSRTGVYGNIRTQDCTNIRVIGVDIEGSSATGIHAINVAGLLIRDCKISDTWADGVHISRGCSQVRILGNEMNYCGDDGVGLVGYKYGGDIDTVYPAMFDIVVANNTIKNLTKSVGRGISVHGCVNCVISGNTIDTVFDSGILVGAVGGDDPVNATHYTHHLTIVGNTVTNVGQGDEAAKIGIFVSYARHFIIEANTVFDSPGDGITVFAVAKDGKIKGNDVSQVSGRGIIIEQVAQTEPARLFDELFTDLGDSGLSTVGISDIQIVGNTVCKVTDAQAIIVAGQVGLKISGALIAHNNIYDCGAHGIYLGATIKATVSHNRIERPTGPGITVGGDKTHVAGNTVIDSDSYGIGFIEVAHCTAHDNYVTGCDGGIYSDPGSSYIFATGNTVFGNTSFQILLDTSTNNNSSAFNNFGHDYQDGDQGYYQGQPANPYGVWVGGDPATPLNRVKDYAGAGDPATGLGQVGSTWRDTNGAGFWYKIASAAWLNLKGFFEYVTGSTTAIRTITSIDQIGVNCDPASGVALDVTNGHVRGQLRVLDSVGGGPARIPASGPKIIGSAKIDLGAPSTDITGRLDIPNGGTNATTAIGARSNLDVYSKAEVDSLLSDKQDEIDALQTELDDHEARLTTVESNLTALQGAYATHGHTVYVTTVTHSHTDPQGGTTGNANVNEPTGSTSGPS